jgi:hypothetical protein
MANVLNHEKKQQILALGQLGWSLRRIQAATHVRRETISTYLKAAGLGVWPPGGWGRQTVSKPAIGVTTDFGVELRGRESENPSRHPSASACKPFQEAIELGLSRGRNAMAIWQDLVSEHGFSNSYQSVKRYIHKRRGSELPQATAVILTAPGEEAQVDYGTGPMVRDPHSGKYGRVAALTIQILTSCVRRVLRVGHLPSSPTVVIVLKKGAPLGVGCDYSHLRKEHPYGGERLLERRKKQAQFRDSQYTLDNFEGLRSSHRRLHRPPRDALSLGRPGTGKSHLAQTIGQAAIQQGYACSTRDPRLA